MVIPLDPRQHRAVVDANGNIMLPDCDVSSEELARALPQHAAAQPAFPDDPIVEHRTHALRSASATAHDAAAAVLSEGAEQYRSSAAGALQGVREIARVGKRTGRNVWAFLAQPVWVVSRKHPKRYSRATLFALDIVRFGGTFAALFVALFAALNYQSFWDIVQARLQPIRPAAAIQSPAPGVDAEIAGKLLRSPSLAVAGRLQGDLLSFLPDVGPPDNRIIIPKLNLNVPLVSPSLDNLLKEDWAGVEEDIQHALQQGVVHYPGTARPGQAGNFFVTGHSSYYPWAPGKYKTVFARLHELEAGDEYWVYYGGDRHRFRVTGKTEVKPTNVDVLDQPLDRRTATLMTCTPVGTTLRRLIVTAEEIDPLSGLALRVGEHAQGSTPKVRPEQLPI